jgi:hypothetical protein
MNRWFVDACREAGHDIVVVDPTRLGLRMLGRKTDRRDALEITRRLALGDIDRCARTIYPTTAEGGVHKLSRSRHRVVEVRQEIVNQIRALRNACELVVPSASLYSPKCLTWLKACSLRHVELGFVLQHWLQMLEAVLARIDEVPSELTIRSTTRRDERTKDPTVTYAGIIPVRKGTSAPNGGTTELPHEADRTSKERLDGSDFVRRAVSFPKRGGAHRAIGG